MPRGSGELWSLGSGGGSSGEGVDASYVIHVVKLSDTLYGIAVEYNTDVTALRRANGLMHEGKGRDSWRQVLLEGQQIRVPVTEENRDRCASQTAAGAGERTDKRRYQQRASEVDGSGSGPPLLTSGDRDLGGVRVDTVPRAIDELVPAAWRIPYVHMSKGQVTQLTRGELEVMLATKKRPSTFTQEVVGARDADVLILVEMPDCSWCAKAHPAWRQLAAKLGKTNPEVRVCAFTTDTPEARVFAGQHLAAKTYPTVIALPRRGGVFKYGGTDRSAALLGSFAEAAFETSKSRETEVAAGEAAAARGAAPKAAVTGTTTVTHGKDAVTEEGEGWQKRRERRQDERRREKEESQQRGNSETGSAQSRVTCRSPSWERDAGGGTWGGKLSSQSSSGAAAEARGGGGNVELSRAVAAGVGGVYGVAKAAAPFALTGLIIGLFVSGALKVIYTQNPKPKALSPKP